MIQPYQRVDPKSEEYFQAIERRGAPQDPILWFKELYALLLKDKEVETSFVEYPLYQALAQFSRQDKSVYEYIDATSK